MCHGVPRLLAASFYLAASAAPAASAQAKAPPFWPGWDRMCRSIETPMLNCNCMISYVISYMCVMFSEKVVIMYKLCMFIYDSDWIRFFVTCLVGLPKLEQICGCLSWSVCRRA